MLDGPLSSGKPHKTEDGMNSDPVFPPGIHRFFTSRVNTSFTLNGYMKISHFTDSCESMLSSISMDVGSSEPMVDGIQRLSSNVISKQPSTMDAQYMQQQSQVFVFSTELANKSAESVIQGYYPTIIEFHRAQPKTKKYLEVCARFLIVNIY